MASDIEILVHNYSEAKSRVEQQITIARDFLIGKNVRYKNGNNMVAKVVDVQIYMGKYILRFADGYWDFAHFFEIEEGE